MLMPILAFLSFLPNASTPKMQALHSQKKSCAVCIKEWCLLSTHFQPIWQILAFLEPVVPRKHLQKPVGHFVAHFTRHSHFLWVQDAFDTDTLDCLNCSRPFTSYTAITEVPVNHGSEDCQADVGAQVREQVSPTNLPRIQPLALA